jgi:hypothetical protein
MRKITVAIGIVCVMALAGCANVEVKSEKAVETEKATPVADQNTVTQTVTIVPEKETVVPAKAGTYEDWQIVFPEEARKFYQTEESFLQYLLWPYFDFDVPRTDCLGMKGGETYGGDLLSTLIVNDKVRALSLVRLKVYSKDYLKALEKKAATYTQSTEKSDFYAFSVCNLGKDYDVMAGYLWPAGQKTTSEKLDDAQKILLLANKDKVYGFKDIQTIDKTATGGEVGPCTPLLKNGNLEWTCFTGLGQEPNGQGAEKTFGQYRNWQISPDGKILKTWDSRD